MSICKGLYERILMYLDEITSLRSFKMIKQDNTFVSKGDLLCQSIIMDFFNEIYDDAIVISEELSPSLDSFDLTKRIITIDPIDGTENFVNGLKEWGVGVSIYCNGIHEESMIALPELGICLCTGGEIEVFKGSRICGLSSYMSPKDFEGLDKAYEYRIMGCCMFNMYNVIRGTFCKFLHLKGAYSWDILPGFNLALEHGLDVLVEGNPYRGEFLMPGIKYHFMIQKKTELN